MVGINLGVLVGPKINQGVGVEVKGQACRAGVALIGFQDGGFLLGGGGG